MFEFDDLDLGVWRGETWVRIQACQDGHRGLLTRGLSWSWPQCWSLGIQNWHISVVVTINWIIVYLPSSCCVPFHKFSCRWRSWRQRWQRWRRRRTRGSRNCRYAKIKMSDICLEKWYFDIISNEFILLQEHNNDLFNKLEEFEERYNNQLDVSRWHSFNLLESITNILDSIKNLQQKTCNI